MSLIKSLLGLAAIAATPSQDFDHVAPWRATGISSPMWESHPAIDPRTRDLWFVRSDKSFSNWRLFVARCTSGRRETAKAMPLAGNGLEADPWFDAGGRTLWFISTGDAASPQSRDLDIWRMTREKSGRWERPERLPAPVNSAFAEWFPRLGADGWLYFGSRRPGGIGKDDIWRAREKANGGWSVENLGARINSAGEEYEFEPAPDGRWGILSTDEGLVLVVRSGSGWRRSSKFGPAINANGTEIGPLIDRQGSQFLFSRDSGGNESGELFAAYQSPRGAPPAECRTK
jgi:hypothetical protein